MIRTAFLLLALLANRHWFWDTGTLNDGSRHVWAGTLVRFEWGVHAALTWDDDGLEWCALWIDRQDPADEFEPWGWCAEGRVGGEVKIVTPRRCRFAWMVA